MARERLYKLPKYGGLGLLNVADMIRSQQCAWLKRIAKHGITDTWRYHLLYKCGFDPANLRLGLMDQDRLEYNIGKSFVEFCQIFWKQNNNYLDAPIFNNPLFSRGKEGRFYDIRLLDKVVAGDAADSSKGWADHSVRLRNCIDNGAIKNYNDISSIFSSRISINNYLAIRRCVAHAVLKYGNKSTSNGTSLELNAFLGRRVKGSRHIRLILSDCKKLLGMTQINTFCNLTGIISPGTNLCELLSSTWSWAFLPVSLRTFIFQFYNNTLPVGARLGNRYHANRIINECCTFCTISAAGVPDRETFPHVMLKCPSINHLIDGLKLDNLCQGEVNAELKLLFAIHDNMIVIPMLVYNLVFFYEIWNSKLSKKIPSITTVRNNVEFTLDGIAQSSAKFADQIRNSQNFSWCRNWSERWPAERQGRG